MTVHPHSSHQQRTESGTRSPSTSALQVPRYSLGQLLKSLATKSNKRQTMKANGMYEPYFLHLILIIPQVFIHTVTPEQS